MIALRAALAEGRRWGLESLEPQVRERLAAWASGAGGATPATPATPASSSR